MVHGEGDHQQTHINTDGVITWIHVPHYLPFVLGIRWLLLDSQHEAPVTQRVYGFFIADMSKLLNK